LNNVEIKNFDHSNLESHIVAIFEQKKVQILLPTDPNFPYVNFIMVDARDQVRRIYLLQVTINVRRHEDSDIFYQFERTKLLSNKTKGTQLISQVMHKIHETNSFLEPLFIWVSGDDIDPRQQVKIEDLIKNKHRESYVTLVRKNPQMAQYL